ncbi:hypothetical protein PanWU01x14_080030, partial [Parasponia andersonii]
LPLKKLGFYKYSIYLIQPIPITDIRETKNHICSHMLQKISFIRKRHKTQVIESLPSLNSNTTLLNPQGVVDDRSESRKLIPSSRSSSCEKPTFHRSFNSTNGLLR